MCSQGVTSDPHINPDRLRESLEGLSVYGRPEGGALADGVSRVGFSDADVAGRNYAMQLMRGLGMEPRVDPAGNIFGSRAGSDQNLKPILFGSHIDSVPSGGNFDGDLGSMSATEAMHARSAASALQGLSVDSQQELPRLEYLLGMILVQKHDYPGALRRLQNYAQLSRHTPDIEMVQTQIAELERLTASKKP